MFSVDTHLHFCGCHKKVALLLTRKSLIPSHSLHGNQSPIHMVLSLSLVLGLGHCR
jgi:hypothetical protein